MKLLISFRRFCIGLSLFMMSTSEVLLQQHEEQPNFGQYQLTTQKFTAIPGTIIDQFVEAPVQSYSVPTNSRLNLSKPTSSPNFSRGHGDSDAIHSENADPNGIEYQPLPTGMEPPPVVVPSGDSGRLQLPASSEHHYYPHYDHGGLVHKHISVHIAPKELELDNKVTFIRPEPTQPEKHINIIFIKAVPTSNKRTEIILPNPPEQKTLLYVLIRKPEPLVRVLEPPPSEPSKPKVFFIRYKQSKDEQGYI